MDCKRLIAYSLTPPEFAIAPPALPAAWSARLEALLKQPPPPTTVADPESLRALGEMGVFLWRLQKRATKTDAPLDRKLVKLINLAGDAFTDAGCVIKDYTGDIYVQGQAIDVRTFQPLEGVARDTVADTLRPGVFFKSHHLVRGDVIVNVPAGGPPDATLAAPIPATSPDSSPNIINPAPHEQPTN